MKRLEELDHFFKNNLETNDNNLAIKFFLKVFYLWNFYYLLSLIPYREFIFGPNNLISTYPFDPNNVFEWAFRILLHQDFAFLYATFAWFALGLLFYLFLRPLSFLALLAYFFLIQNLHHKAYVILDGGNNLQELLLIYSLFITVGYKFRKYRLGLLLKNSFFFICKIQVVFVYATAGLAKLTGPMWQKGVALYYALSLSNYSNPYLKDFFLNSDFLLTFGNYYTLFFQISFPFLVWFKQTRPFVLFMGVILHFQISTVMGLFFFGMVMIAAYSLFLDGIVDFEEKDPYRHRKYRLFEIFYWPFILIKNLFLNPILKKETKIRI